MQKPHQMSFLKEFVPVAMAMCMCYLLDVDVNQLFHPTPNASHTVQGVQVNLKLILEANDTELRKELKKQW